MKYLIANWKMNLGVGESLDLLAEMADKMNSDERLEVVICPSSLALVPVIAKNKKRFSIGAQNCFYEKKGNYTGEVSADQLKDLAQYCLIGHSERRQFFNENDTEVNLKIKACLNSGIKPILCIGENLNQNQNGETDTVLRNQLDGALMGVSADKINQVIVAYEPVWAIGSGLIPNIKDLDITTRVIKTQLEFMYGETTTPILYGGSVTEENTAEIMSIPQVDGLLVGSSSLNAEKFAIIEEIMKRGSGHKWSQN